jgi:hypothetical protein
MALVTVGTVLTLKERFKTLSLQNTTFQDGIMEANLLSGFVFVILLPFLNYMEIYKKINFINSWGNFQVCVI